MRVIAHRGDTSHGHLENTAAAVRTAVAGGADGVEVDLRLSEDGVLVACHDPDIRRVAGAALDIASWPWATLRAAALPVELARVEDVLAAVGPRPVVLELKPTPEIGRTVEALMACLAGAVPRDVTVSSFDLGLVRAVAGRTAGTAWVRTALLGVPGRPAAATLQRAVDAGIDQVHPHWQDLLREPSVLDHASDAGVQVVPWTVNHPVQLRRCAELGVAAVITDAPRLARRAAFTSGRAA